MNIDNYDIFGEITFCEHEFVWIDQSYEEVFTGFFECEFCGYEDTEREYDDFYYGDEVI